MFILWGKGSAKSWGGAENFEVPPWGGHLSFKIVSGGEGDHESFLMSCGPKEWNAAPGQNKSVSHLFHKGDIHLDAPAKKSGTLASNMWCLMSM